MGIWNSIRTWVRKNVLGREEPEIIEPVKKKEEEQIYKIERETKGEIKEGKYELRTGEEVKDKEVIKEAREDRAKMELRIARDTIRKKENILKIEEGIKDEGENIVEVPITANISILREMYGKVISGNAKLNDPEILDIIIQNRHKLKHRFSSGLKVYGNGEIVGILTITGILMEDSEVILDHIRIGQSIEESDELRKILTKIGNSLTTNKGAIGQSIVIYKPTGFKVTDLKQEFTFA